MFAIEQHAPAFVFARVRMRGVIGHLVLVLGEGGRKGVLFLMFTCVVVGDRDSERGVRILRRGLGARPVSSDVTFCPLRTQQACARVYVLYQTAYTRVRICAHSRAWGYSVSRPNPGRRERVQGSFVPYVRLRGSGRSR